MLFSKMHHLTTKLLKLDLKLSTHFQLIHLPQTNGRGVNFEPWGPLRVWGSGQVASLTAQEKYATTTTSTVGQI